MNIASKDMKKKKDEKGKKFSQRVRGKSIPATETTEVTSQKKIKFNENENEKVNVVPATPKSVKQEKKVVDKTDTTQNTAVEVTDHKFLGINYHEYHIDELQQRAREIDLDGRSRMNKEELIETLYENHSRDEIYEVAAKADISGRSKMSKSQLINELRKRTDNTPNKNQKTSSNKNNSTAGNSSKTNSKNSSGKAYYKRSREELYEVAKEQEIDGRSQMDKKELLEALYKDHTREELYEMAKTEDIKGRSSMSKKQLIYELQKA